MRASLRAAAPADARGIAEVHVGSWRWAYRGQVPDPFLEALSVDERETQWWLATRERPGDTVVAELDGAIVGFVSVGPAQGASLPTGAGELFAIYIAAPVAGTGVGASLLAAGVERLRGAGFDQAILWVLAANDRARAFYEGAGWALDGTRAEHAFGDERREVVRYARAL